VILKAILNSIVSALPELVKGQSAFISKAREQACVVISGNIYPYHEIPIINRLAMDAVAIGYDAEKGFSLLSSVVEAIVALEGTTISDGVGNSYVIGGVIVNKSPSPISTDTGIIYSSDIEVMFRI